LTFRVRVPPPCDELLGLTCVDKEEPGHTVWTMFADERFANPVGAVQGGIIASFADSAMAATAVTANRGRRVFVANTDLDVRFFSGVAVGQLLTCRADALVCKHRATFLEAEVIDASGAIVAKASATFLVTERTD
jgi:uncharacterized protein (TIGR00369 family)